MNVTELPPPKRRLWLELALWLGIAFACMGAFVLVVLKLLPGYVVVVSFVVYFLASSQVLGCIFTLMSRAGGVRYSRILISGYLRRKR